MNGLAALLVCLAAASCSSDLTEELPDATPLSVADAAPCPAITTYFLNPYGETFTSGETNDPQTNTSAIVAENSDPVTLASAGISADVLGEVTGCVNELISPYNIRVTETDPSPDAHHEIVLTSDSSTAIGLGGSKNDVSVFACADVTNLAFVFRTNQNSVREVCQSIVTAMLRTAHVDTLLSCPTLPTNLSGCGDKTIVDAEALCGDAAERDCACGGATINPHEAMLDQFGAACSQ